MILQCPACNARYAVPDHALGATGRSVRCAKCAHQWHAKPDTGNISSEALDMLLKEPEKPTIKPMKKGANVPAIVAPAFSAKLIMGLAASLLFAVFTTLFSHHPAWFGLASTNNIVFSELKLAKQDVANGVEYGISGKLVNLADSDTALPIIRITLVDKDGGALKTWHPGGELVLPAKGSQNFSFAPLATSLMTGDRLVLEMGNSFELALRAKP